MMTSESIILDGFHGTSVVRAEAILAKGYHYVSSAEDWLGSGVYFFLDGFACAFTNASEWALSKYAEEQCVVVKSRIECQASKVLDLTTCTGLKEYNDARVKVLKKFGSDLFFRRDLSIKKRRDIRVDDKIIIDLVLRELSFDVLIHNVYIKNRQQRSLALESSYPNATVCSVSNLECIVGCEVMNVSVC